MVGIPSNSSTSSSPPPASCLPPPFWEQGALGTRNIFHFFPPSYPLYIPSPSSESLFSLFPPSLLQSLPLSYPVGPLKYHVLIIPRYTYSVQNRQAIRKSNNHNSIGYIFYLLYLGKFASLFSQKI